MKQAFSLQGKFTLLVTTMVVVAIAVATIAAYWLPLPWSAVVAVFILLPLSLFVTARYINPIVALINALADSTDNIKDRDFSITIANNRSDELGRLVARHNEIGQLLREERYNINQRELLLDTVLQSTPVAMWLCDDQGRIVYANVEARQLLAEGKRIQERALGQLIETLNPALKQGIAAGSDGLVSVEEEGEVETYYLSCRYFSLNARRHRLHLVRHMTRELSRQEVNIWKRVIRVISHELNNSLAPISSLSHSGKLAMAKLQNGAERSEDWNKLALILSSIGDRANHLKTFIEGYVRFARLPNPTLAKFDLIATLNKIADPKMVIESDHEELVVNLDETQMEQVLINLQKNALDVSAESIVVQLQTRGNQLIVTVADDGPGMPEQVLQQALLPFYSTKQEGTGLGLPLCREITEAHGGVLAIRNGRESGIEVVLRFPGAVQT